MVTSILKRIYLAVERPKDLMQIAARCMDFAPSALIVRESIRLEHALEQAFISRPEQPRVVKWPVLEVPPIPL